MAYGEKKLDLTNENQSTVKVILYLAWPLFLEQVLSTLVSFADTAMVGTLGAKKKGEGRGEIAGGCF